MLEGYLDCLLSPASYDEVKDVQQALKMYWQILFPDYTLARRLDMPSTWQPDLIGYSKNEILLIEVKAHGGNRKHEAVVQVVGYAEELHEAYPGTSVKLLAIGPWKTKQDIDIVDYDGYQVGVIDIRDIGESLKIQAEKLLLAYSYFNAFQSEFPILSLAGIQSMKVANEVEGESGELAHGEQ
jgi:hypothetical protein